MKKLLAGLFSLFILLSACNTKENQEEQQNAGGIDSTKLVTVKYSVEGMTCIGCENTVKLAVGEIAGVTEVAASFKDKYATVTYDSSKVKDGQIEKAITDKGYTFKGVYAEPQPE